MKNTLSFFGMSFEIGSDGGDGHLFKGHFLFIDEQFADAFVFQAIGTGKAYRQD
ncbi:MAG: hypothetical protein ACD_75C00197G0004 [uncultured bacterium]|nr:MAG: hypothetical protein ACD_75C00197G0004 [uncultured bacterium]